MAPPVRRFVARTSPAASTVFSMVLTRGPVSRVEIARRTGLSSAAVTKAARPFIEAGYLEELSSTVRSGPISGRPANPLAIRGDREFFAGVKITEDKLIGVVTDLRAQVLTSAHLPLTTSTVPGVVAELASLVADLLAESPAYRERCHSLGVAMSGDIDRAGGIVRYSPFLGWRQVSLEPLLSAATGLTVTLENDVRSLTIAEQWFGEGVGAATFALVSVGIGIGCGLVVDGRVAAGSRDVAGLASYDLFAQPIGEAFARQAFGAAADCQLIHRPLPFEQWARGAAAVAIETLFAHRER